MTTGLDLLGDQRQAALLPGQPGRPVRDGGRPGDNPGVRHQPAVSFLVCPLAGNGEIGPGRIQRADQAIHITAQRTAVGRHRSRVNQHTRRHDQYRSFPLRYARTYLARTRARQDLLTPGRAHAKTCRHNRKPRPGCPVRSERTPSAAPTCRGGGASAPARRALRGSWPAGVQSSTCQLFRSDAGWPVHGWREPLGRRR